MAVTGPLYVAKLRRARAAWVFDLGPVTLIFTTIVLVSVTSMLYLTQASRVAATGYDISSAQERLAKLEREDQLLLMEVAEKQSLQRVESEATSKQGMVPAPPPAYLRVGAPPVDVEDALRKAERAAQHRPRDWREQIAFALRLRTSR
jgi:hypothetical protein